MSEFNLRVYYSDTDAGGVVYHAAYVNFYDRARTEFFRTLGIDSASLRERQSVFVVRKLAVEYLSPAFLDELLNVKTVITSSGKIRLTVEQTITNDQNEIINRCEVLLVYIDLTKRRPSEIQSDFYEKLAAIPLESAVALGHDPID